MRALTQMLSMEGRRVLITGAASGIGRAMTIRFAEAGAELLLVNHDETRLAYTAKELSSIGARLTTQVVDLRHKGQIDRFWKDLEEEPPDTLINNAGCYPMLDYLETTAGFLEETLLISLRLPLRDWFR